MNGKLEERVVVNGAMSYRKVLGSDSDEKGTKSVAQWAKETLSAEELEDITML